MGPDHLKTMLRITFATALLALCSTCSSAFVHSGSGGRTAVLSSIRSDVVRIVPEPGNVMTDIRKSHKSSTSLSMTAAPGVAIAAITGAVSGGFFAGGLHAIAGKFDCDRRTDHF